MSYVLPCGPPYYKVKSKNTGFKGASIRVLKGSQSKSTRKKVNLRDTVLVILVNHDLVDGAVFYFGLSRSSDHGKVLWGTSKEGVWPPSNCRDRKKIFDGVVQCIEEFIVRKGPAKIRDEVISAIERDLIVDVGDYYDVTGLSRMVKGAVRVTDVRSQSVGGIQGTSRLSRGSLRKIANC